MSRLVIADDASISTQPMQASRGRSRQVSEGYIRKLINEELTINETRGLEVLGCELLESLGIERRFEELSKSCKLTSAISKREGIRTEDDTLTTVTSGVRACLEESGAA